MHDRKRAGYTLIEMIGVVVIGAILLTLAVPAIAHSVRVRTAEATLKNDLRNAANSYEQAYLTERKYPASLPLQLSPQVAVDSQAVSGERVYLRLRHVPTGQLCVLDYSRSSPVARNRPDCYAGGLDRDTALTVTADAPPAAPADTFTLSTPGAPVTPPNPLALASPTVDDPPAQTAAPGASLTQAFTVTNRSPVARSFRFETGSSSPAMVGAPSAPVSLTLEPNVPTPVAVTYTVAGDALSDASSVIPLRVIDAEDERWTATGSFSVSISLALAAPSVAVSGAGDRVEDAGQPFDVSWTMTNRTNAARTLDVSLAAVEPAHVQVLSVDGTGRLPFAPGQTRTVTARLRLSAGSDGGTRSTVSVAAADADAPAYHGEAPVGVETRTVLAAPSVAPPASQTADPGVPFTLSWTVTNGSNAPRVFDVTPRVEDPAHVAIIASTGTGAQSIGRGQSLAVSVTYRVLPGSIAGRTSAAALQVTDHEAPDYSAAATTSIGTNIVLAYPTVAPPPDLTGKPGEEFVVRWTVRNGANSPRVLVVDPATSPGAELTLVSAVGAGDVPLDAFETREVSARYRVKSTSLAGAVSAPELRVSDKLMPILTGRGAFAVTTELVLGTPAWVTLPSSPMVWNVGDQRDLHLSFRNTSNGARTFCVQVASADSRRLAVLTPGSVCGIRADAGESVQVAETLRADGGGTGLAVTAVAYDEGAAAYHADSMFYNVIRDSRPTAVWDAPKPVYVRRWATFDGSRSWSPVGSPITKYIWTWGLFMQSWDPAQGRFVATGTWGTARDEVPDAIVQRAYDYQGTFEVCLVVEDAAGRASDPNCQSITTLRSTAARLAWRYRGWWSEKEFCIDVWWSNQCDPEHGNSRWEIDLRPSIGDAQVQQAYAEFTVRLYDTDDPELSTTFYYAGNSGTTPPWGSYSFLQNVPEAVGKAQDGRWRVLTTAGTGAYGWPAAPNLGDHPLVLNINLASATGIFDGGPHWVPDGVWITLHVQDADGRWTTATAYHDHLRTNWQAPYDTSVVAETPPSAAVKVDSLGSGRFRVTGSGDSPEGRIVDAWWEISYEPIAPGGPYNPNTTTARGPSVDVKPADCERALLTYFVVDDHGLKGQGYAEIDGPGGKTCFPTGGPL